MYVYRCAGCVGALTGSTVRRRVEKGQGLNAAVVRMDTRPSGARVVQRWDKWWRNRRQMSPPPTAANGVALSLGSSRTVAGGGGTQVKKFSVKRISNPLMFDPLNNAVPEGLYDPALGPTENHQRCERR
jgi:hypothetical protein